ncbi:zinc-dependent alcohol dehydrogenase family protein [Haloarculaceae archaeon H-GB11]|nr:zinc-dependent alcohol dehydrogenase family protein [Haloarculaceae archaeon H-GB1-1]MEA5387929.1 zinc-dependent alcohol dehydrogenase family protein [Haloarculaceae archaeon H-GB11]
MRAAVLESHGDPLVVESRPDPDPAADGIVVETEACGICRSDWHAWQGHGGWIDDQVPTGHVLGHEPAGEVVAVGDDVETFTEGDVVAVPFSLGCGRCTFCRNGRANVCPNGRAIGFSPDTPGAFAEYVHVPAADFNAVALPDGVSATDMAALGCRFMTAYHALAHRADLAAGDWVAVHGCGGVGLSAVQVASALGARPLAVDLNEEALAMAADFGASVTVDATVDDVPGEIRDATDGGADVSVDALGVAETCRNSIHCLDRTGQHLQVGYTTEAEAGEVSLPIDHVTMHELDVLGSRGMPPSRYDELFGLIESGAVDPGALVTRHVSLDEVPERLAAMDDYGTVGVEVVTEF